MGGDHKCPVCQATFTRPQHVARHMRSHTGDRPYKCQYCGDQFARSDLLSRHVNKCHASEKPPPGAANSRRKGSASASRATTSKQACDQCVQSSLPCDGSNPCSKCVQRKCRCTYVKFHRQTAPIGPGHNPRPQAGSASTRLPGYSSADDFLLGPAPSSIAPIPGDPTSLSSYNASFTFPQLYPSTADSAPPTLAMPTDGDYAKYRSQAEYLRRQTLPFPSTAGPGAPPTNNYLYADPRPSSSSTSWLEWSSDTTSQLAAGTRPQPPIDDPKSEHDLRYAAPSFTYPPVAADPYVSTYVNRRMGHDRRTSVDFGSDSSTSHSVPSSAASSSVHLPLDVPPNAHQQQLAYHVSLDQLREHVKDILTAPSHPHPSSDLSGPQDVQAQAHANFLRQHPPPPQDGGGRGNSGSPANSDQQRQPAAEGGFSSAFGLMSLDDPAILAGLSSDGAPFFTSNGMDMYPGDPDATPMPPGPSGAKVVSHPIQPMPANPTNGVTGGATSNGLVSPASRDVETKELKDFWKQYMRTPLSGPGSNSLAVPPSNGHANASNPVSPGQTYRRARVSSLPSVKTPTVEQKTQYNYPHANGAPGGNGATSSMRTTLHGNADDLRSYEAAVLARRTPLTLNLVPKRARGSTASSTTSPLTTNGASLVNAGNPPTTQLHHYDYHPPGSSGGGSRPSSSSSMTSSSLANAFGKAPSSTTVSFAFQPHSDHDHSGISHSSASPPSRGSTASLEDGEADSFRPSFKRLPSQTLMPANSKRAMLNHDGGDDDSDAAADEENRRRGYHHQGASPPKGMGGGSGGGSTMHHGMMPPPSMTNLANRRRRMSAPDTSPTVPSFAAAGQL